ncbi:hypothetical protein ACIBKZ_18105 [Streptomyces sp. NPDC050421]|uniref:hypothetical protein n=1 Tax=Streptomyces sp. NPDC050421 TaxID=3365613 RepID=UPI00379E6AB1
MRIRMKVTLSGTRNGEDWPPAGEIADIPTGEAQHLIASGIAEDAAGRKGQLPKVETAVAPNTAETRGTARKAAAPKTPKG